MITQFDYRILKFIKERKVVMLVDLMMKTGKKKCEVHELLYQFYIPKKLVCLMGMKGNDKLYKLTELGAREVEIYEDNQKNINLMNQKDNYEVVQKNNYWTIVKKFLKTIYAKIATFVFLGAASAQILDSQTFSHWGKNVIDWFNAVKTFFVQIINC